MDQKLLDKEYNTVLLAGLLHDIGKLQQRVDRDSSYGKHSILSKVFTGQVLLEIWKNADEYINRELLELLVENHHEENIRKVKNSKTKEEVNLMYLVSEADNTSAKERREKDNINVQEFRLFSVFDVLKDAKEDFLSYPANGVFYPGYWEKALDIDRNVLSKPLSELLKGDRRDYNFIRIYNSLYEFLLRYGYLVPDSTLTKYPHTSLFTHSIFTSAVAGCLYQYHKENNSLDERSIKNTREEKFVIYVGALFPVQSFLFEIMSENPKHIAKILRGRSVLLLWTAEAIAYDILSECDLPISNLISKQGVKFTLLLPNTKRVAGILSRKQAEISEFLAERFSLRLNYASAQIKLCQDDFKKEKSSDKKEGDSKLYQKWQELGARLSRNKFCVNIPYGIEHILKRKYDSLLSRISDANGNIFCAFCGAEFSADGSIYCKFCGMSDKVGEYLANRYDIITFFKGEPTRDNSFKLSPGISVFFQRRVGDSLREDVISYRISVVDKEKLGYFNMDGVITRTLSSYVPSKRDNDVRSYMEKVCNEDVCPFYNRCDADVKEKDGTLTFQCIALGDKDIIIVDNERNNKIVYGDDLLAVLKGDVDSLGDVLRKFSRSSDYTMASMLQFAYQLDYFFSSVLPYKMSNSGNPKYKLVYVLYSGGDDFVLIGPWRSMLNFSFDMYDWFRKYTDGTLTFSAGLSLFKPKSPLKWAINEAEEALSYAKKQEGKNKLCFYLGGEKFLIDWGKYNSNVENLLVEAIKKGELSRSRLNRFIDLRNMAKEVKDWKDYLYVSYFRYISTRDLKGQKKTSKELEQVYSVLAPYYSSDVEPDKLNELGLALKMSLIETRRC